MKKSNWHGGKGSTPRTDTNSKQYQDNWDTIFGKNVKDLNKKFPKTLERLEDIKFPQRTNISNRNNDTIK